MISSNLQSKLKQISVIISDVDGVLTDGSVFIGSDGTEFKRFSVEDGAGAAFARLAELPVALISGRYSDSTALRAKEMQIDMCYHGNLNKQPAFHEICEKLNVTADSIAYIGDGLIDIPVMELSAVTFAPPNSHQLVKDISDHITKRSGGTGVLREVVELILKAQGRYDQVFALMKQKVYKS